MPSTDETYLKPCLIVDLKKITVGGEGTKNVGEEWKGRKTKWMC